MYQSKQFVELRCWTIDREQALSGAEVKEIFVELIRAAGYPIEVVDITIDNRMPGLALRYAENQNYMPLYIYGNADSIWMALEGKGEQVKATDLVKLYHKAAGALSGMHASYKRTQNKLGRLGISSKSASLGVGIGLATGAAIGGSVRLLAKGVSVLMRDKEAYEKEMAFYDLALNLGDFLIGGTDNGSLITVLMEKAEEGNLSAQFILACAYSEGRGIEMNLAESVKWFACAAENGEVRSRAILAYEYLYGENEYGLEEKHKGLTYMKELADAGDEDAAACVVDILGNGTIEGIPTDLSEMIPAATNYAVRGNIDAMLMLARTYDTMFSNGSANDSIYKDDNKASYYYRMIVELRPQTCLEEVTMCLVQMYTAGRSADANESNLFYYSEIAASCGNLEAKRLLAYYYTFGIGTGKNYEAAKKLCDELLRSKNQNAIPMAYYCKHAMADAEKKYKKSMDFARKYIQCERAEADKKAELKKYLEQKEALIRNMPEEERREYLQEDNLFTNALKYLGNMDKRKWIIIASVAFVVILIIVLVFVFGNREESDTALWKTAKSTVEIDADNRKQQEAFEAYNDLLTQDSIEKGPEDNQYEWKLNNCEFSVAYIDDDDIPEIILHNSSDRADLHEYGEMFTIEDGEASTLEYLYLSDASKIGYFEKTGWYMDCDEMEDEGSIFIEELKNCDLMFQIMYTIDEDGEKSDFKYYEIQGNTDSIELSKEEFKSRINEVIGDVPLTEYDFCKNTSDNREEHLGLEENENPAGEIFEAYNDFLTQDNILREAISGDYQWKLENCEFSLACIDADDTPELILYNLSDTEEPEADGCADMYTVKDGEVVLIETLELQDVRGIGYFEKTEWFMVSSSYLDRRLVVLERIDNLDLMFQVSYVEDEDGELSDFEYYEIRDNVENIELSEEEFEDRIAEVIGDVPMTEYEFYTNTAENREKYLGIKTEEEDVAVENEETATEDEYPQFTEIDTEE